MLRTQAAVADTLGARLIAAEAAQSGAQTGLRSLGVPRGQSRPVGSRAVVP